jgi:hypothetical protein
MIQAIGNGSGNSSGSAITRGMPLILSFENGSGSGSGSGSAIFWDTPLILSVDPTRSVLPMIGVPNMP